MTLHSNLFVRAVAALIVGGTCQSVSRGADPATRPAAAPPAVLPATVEPFEQADLYAKTSGYIADVTADIGDSVKGGQLLAVIEQPELESELAEAQATLAAKGKLKEAADAAVKQSEAARDVAKGQVGRYEAEVRLQDATLRRQEELHRGKAVTEQQLDEARSKAEVARSDVAIAETKLHAAEADVLGAKAAVGVAEAQVKVTAAQVARIETMQRYLKVVAPFDGVVSRRLVNRGDLTQVGAGRSAALFTVQRIDTVRVRADVPEGLAHRIGRGTPVSVKVLAAGGDPIAAAVTRSAGSLNPESRTMRVEIDLPNKERRLVPGAYVQVTFVLDAVPPVAAVPTGR